MSLRYIKMVPNTALHSVILYYKAPVILIINISFNHILLYLASFDLNCGSFAVYGVAVLVAPGAIQAIQHILWIQLFSAILIMGFLLELFYSTL